MAERAAVREDVGMERRTPPGAAAEDVHLVWQAAGRRARIESVLAALLGELAGVPSSDVELSFACPVCGARHGRPSVGYPATPSGGEWFGDAAVGHGGQLAAASLRHRVGVGLEAIVARPSQVLERAAFHPEELAALDALELDVRAHVRATLWARKAALLRVLGHPGILEPAGFALSIPGADAGAGRIVRANDELAGLAARIEFRDVAVTAGTAGSVAILR